MNQIAPRLQHYLLLAALLLAQTISLVHAFEHLDHASEAEHSLCEQCLSATNLENAEIFSDANYLAFKQFYELQQLPRLSDERLSRKCSIRAPPTRYLLNK